MEPAGSNPLSIPPPPTDCKPHFRTIPLYFHPQTIYFIIHTHLLENPLPCCDDYPDDTCTRITQNEYDELHTAEAIACGLLKLINTHQIPFEFWTHFPYAEQGITQDQINSWYTNHQARDEARKEAEARNREAELKTLDQDIKHLRAKRRALLRGKDA